MRNAYALLGLLFIIILVGAYMAVQRAEAPTPEEMQESEEQATTNEQPEPMALTLTTPAFGNQSTIPKKYTCDGDNVNPEFHISGVPEGTKSLVLVMDDPDIPDSVKASMGIEKFDHWVLYNIPPETTVIQENASVGTEGLTSRGESGYVGACPPKEYEPQEHRYFFRLYAVSGTLNFIKAPTLNEVEEAAKGMAIESATLMGRYERK